MRLPIYMRYCAGRKVWSVVLILVQSITVGTLKLFLRGRKNAETLKFWLIGAGSVARLWRGCWGHFISFWLEDNIVCRTQRVIDWCLLYVSILHSHTRSAIHISDKGSRSIFTNSAGMKETPYTISPLQQFKRMILSCFVIHELFSFSALPLSFTGLPHIR